MLTQSKLIAPKNAPVSTQAKEQPKATKFDYQPATKLVDSRPWPFLYGRKSIIQKLPIDKDAKVTILEIGCGTGKNLKYIAKKFPQAQLYGIDESPEMTQKAQKNVEAYQDRVEIIQAPYQEGLDYPFEQVDGIVFSYALGKLDKNWEDLLNRAWEDLKPGGWVAVVDFHNSGFGAFKKRMENRLIKLDGHLLRFLRDHFLIHLESVKSAYAGAWSYFLFVGKKL